MHVAFGMWNKSFCNIISWCCTLVIKARIPVSSSSTVCHLLFSITFLEAFPTAAGNNQRLLLANSLRLSSFQFCEFETIPEDKINTKLKRCVVVRGSCRGGVPGYSAGTNLPRRLRADLKIHEVLWMAGGFYGTKVWIVVCPARRARSCEFRLT